MRLPLCGVPVRRHKEGPPKVGMARTWERHPNQFRRGAMTRTSWGRERFMAWAPGGWESRLKALLPAACFQDVVGGVVLAEVADRLARAGRPHRRCRCSGRRRCKAPAGAGAFRRRPGPGRRWIRRGPVRRSRAGNRRARFISARQRRRSLEGLRLERKQSTCGLLQAKPSSKPFAASAFAPGPFRGWGRNPLACIHTQREPVIPPAGTGTEYRRPQAVS